ncbi:MAG: peptidoglycan-binding domain-containing protein [Acidimicrobiales bacterium]
MHPFSTRRIVGIAVLALAIVAGVAGCSSDNKSSDSSTTTTAASSPTTTAASSPTTSGVKPVSTLTKADVVQMQEWLDAVGCDVGNNDGVIGPLTIASLKGFQKGAGLSVDGSYGPLTKSALSADAQAKKKICVLPAPTPAPVGPTGSVAPCTNVAITQGLNPGLDAGRGVAKVNGFGCDSGWAYAFVTLGAPANIDVVDILASRDGQWVSQDRATACQPGKIPALVYTNGCTTS